MAVNLIGRKHLIADSTSLIRDNEVIDIMDVIDEHVSNFAPETLDTLREFAEAINNDENFFITIQTQINTKAPINSLIFTWTISGISKAMVQLGNVDNTSDANKPISTATQTALNLKANQSTTYSKTEIGNSLVLKSYTSTTSSKTEVDDSLALEANQATTRHQNRSSY